MFGDIYKNKKVIVTGHTGFKGSWLIMWLLHLKADVVGISKDIPTNPSMFEIMNRDGSLINNIKHYQLDIRDFSKLDEVFKKEKPDFVFHLAAQAIVSLSYHDPIETISSNVVGTLNVLEVLRGLDYPCVAIMITSDKAYDNIDQVWGYKENDHIGGKDIYSGSKGAADLLIKSYFYSFFNKENSNIRIGTARAGNVIGGGDWAKDRIVVDCMSSWNQNKVVQIRSPNATRPWQHVLEPLSGYLNLGQCLYINPSLNGESFNFGPKAEQNRTVKQLLTDLSRYWDFSNVEDAFTITNEITFDEASLLKLNCDKALFFLKWQAVLDYEDTIKLTSQWYFDFLNTDKNIFKMTNSQITYYQNKAEKMKLTWTE